MRFLSKHLIFALLSLAAAYIVGTETLANETDRPNIVFFLVDDLGWQDTSVAFGDKPTRFQQHFRTPHVKRLAEQGIRFSRAYSCAVCSPTRTSIMTGQNAARHRVTNWTFYADRETSGRTNRLLPPEHWKREGLQPDQVTLPMLLRTVGYRTIHCGKAHWGAYQTAGSDPTRLGFDVNIAGHHAGAPGSYQGRDGYGNQAEDAGRRRWAVPGLEKYHGTDTHLTDALAIEACSAIGQAVADSQPFFLYMAPYAVHTPIQEHPRFIGNYRGRTYPGTELPIPEVEARYASLVEGFDDALGRILDKLEQAGVAGNTIVVFTSDNGGLSAHARGTTPLGTGANTHCWPLREGKGSAYEGGIRVPLIVSWAMPAKELPQQIRLPIKPSSRSAVPVICEDYFPTICRWAGVDIDESSRQCAENNPQRDPGLARPIIDGIDITAMVTGTTDTEARPLFFHYPHVWGPRGDGYQPHSSMLLDRYKLIFFHHARRWELYDLEQDISERQNLAGQLPDKLMELSELMLGPSGLGKFNAEFPKQVPGSQYVEAGAITHAAIEPSPGRESNAAAAGWAAGSTWLDQHREINAMAGQGDAEIVFLGDSITQSWGGTGRTVSATAPEVWQKYFGNRRARNFGISGDKTQNVLWRIEHGNFDGLDPALIVVNIGTNNLQDCTAPEIADGIEQVVLRLEERRGRARILLLGIFPRGREPDLAIRSRIADVNSEIRKLADDRKTFFADFGHRFLDDEGFARTTHFGSDFVHLTQRGYQEWAEAITPVIDRILDKQRP